MESHPGKQWLLSQTLGELLPGVFPDKKLTDRLAASFRCGAEGLGVDKGLLFLVRAAIDGVRLVPIASLAYTPEELKHLASGRAPDDCEDISPTHLLTDTTGPAIRLGWNHRFLIVQIVNPVLNQLAAVALFAREKDQPEFGDQELKWGHFYSLAAGQAVGREVHEPGHAMTEAYPVADVAGAPQLVGNSLWTEGLRRDLHQIYIPSCGARDPDPILILGEKGTGKDLIARYIGAYSIRRKKPFIAVNCAEITDELASSRFFGHRKGSFTGSAGDEPGFFRAAEGGVLFLDEIAELSLRAQATLLRVLENRTIVPLGETREIRVDVQVVLATNHDLDVAVAQKVLRADLCDRFRIQAIHLLPLRERPTDIPLLAGHFIAHHEQRMDKKIMGVDPDVLRAMVGYCWPGNVRELARLCSLLVAHTPENVSIGMGLLGRLLPEVIKGERNPKAGALLLGNVSMREALRIFEREIITSRLNHFSWDAHATRQSLGMPKTTFHRRLRKLKLIPKVDDSTALPGFYRSPVAAITREAS